jgi:hypothetical protein
MGVIDYKTEYLVVSCVRCALAGLVNTGSIFHSGQKYIAFKRRRTARESRDVPVSYVRCTISYVRCTTTYR